MGDFIFYTDPTGIDLKNRARPFVPYHKFRKKPDYYLEKYEKGIVDSGVYQLKKHGKYKYIDEYPLDIPERWPWVIPDYPHDLLPHLTGEECVKRTTENVKKWINCRGALPTVQFAFLDFADFTRRHAQFIADYAEFITDYCIGNLCRLNKLGTELNFLKRVIKYCVEHNDDGKGIHFFGLPLRGIRYLIQCHPPFPVSVDSTNWTRNVLRGTKCDRGRTLDFNATGKTRQQFFEQYIDIIEEEELRNGIW